ncbi:MAG: C-terminal binding protein [Spirochaetota bacterium]
MTRPGSAMNETRVAGKGLWEAFGNRNPLVVITDNRFGDTEIERAVLEPFGVELVVASCTSSSEVAAACREADGILANLAPVDGSALESFERCRVVSRYGVGLDSVDIETAKRLGIAVRNVPGYCDREVAEHALGLIFAIARGIPARDRSIRSGAWNSVAHGKRIAGTCLGVLGFGGTAKALVRAGLALGFGEILVWSPHISEERIVEAFGPLPGILGVPVRCASFDELLAGSDWVSVNLPLKPGTRGLVDTAALALMRPGSALVNIARGPIVDEEALTEALRGGRLAGAGLDVFAAEPLPKGSALRSMPNVVLTDHCAYASRESIVELRRRCAENALEELVSYSNLVPRTLLGEKRFPAVVASLKGSSSSEPGQVVLPVPEGRRPVP